MEKYKGRLQKITRVFTVLVTVCGVIAIILCVWQLSGVYAPMITPNKDWQDFLSGVRIGMFIGFEAVLIYRLTRYRRALKKPDLLEKLYIQETDERTVFILQKSFGATFGISIILFAFCGIVASFWSMEVFLTLIVCAAALGLINKCCRVYYRKRF